MTDIHLNFLGTQQIEDFLAYVAEGNPDTLVISGDIGESHSFIPFLERMEAYWERPIYFVLGNHDYYFSSIERVRGVVSRLTDESPYLAWLPQVGVVQLAADTALVGHDGWADGRYGDYANSELLLNDYILIGELAGLQKAARLQKLNQFGDEAAHYLRRILPPVLERYRRVFVVTHVPPFKEACRYDGKYADVESLPHFACQAVGNVLLAVMRDRPNCDMTVLCGHTHGKARVQVLPNLLVLTGGAEYGEPIVQEVFDL